MPTGIAGALAFLVEKGLTGLMSVMIGTMPEYHAGSIAYSTPGSGLDGNLHEARRPAALEAAAAIAGVVVHGDVQHVVAGFAEHGVVCLPAKGLRRCPTGQLLNPGLLCRTSRRQGRGTSTRRASPADVRAGHGAFVPLVYFMSSVTQTVKTAAPDNEVVDRGLASCDRTLNRLSVRSNRMTGGVLWTAISLNGLDHVIRVQPKRNAGGLTVRDDRPGVLVLWREILRHRNDEHSPLPAGQEMRRLPHVGPARLDPVVGPNRNVELLLRCCDCK